MTLSTTNKLGTILGRTLNEQTDVERNIEGDETYSSFTLEISEIPEVEYSLTLVKKNLPTTGFIMDHPVYGNLNNNNYIFNQDYASTESIGDY